MTKSEKNKSPYGEEVMMKLVRYLRMLALSATVVVSFSAVAVAGPFRLRIEDLGSGQGAVITDNGAGDSNSTLGVITFSGSLPGGFIVNVTTGLSKPVLGAAGAEMDLNSVNVQTIGAGTLRITLEDTSFTDGIGQVSFLGGVGGTLNAPAGSSATFNTWVNPSNLVPTLGPDTNPAGALPLIGGIPAGSIAAFGGGVSFGPGAYSATAGVPFIVSGPFAMFSQATISFTGQGSVSFDLDSHDAPEPSSMILLGTGLL